MRPSRRCWPGSPRLSAKVEEKTAHLEEVLTGYRLGSAESAGLGEPREGFDPDLPITSRYAAKAAELGVTRRTLERWVSEYKDLGPAALAAGMQPRREGQLERADPRWVEMALEIMAEHTEQSRPTQAIIIERTAARLTTRFGADTVKMPSRATAYRLLEELDRRVPTFRGSAKRRREAADQPDSAYDRLRPTRPGEYLLLDTTRSDVFALDPITLRWVQAEITVAMDWYTRCITGLRVTPVSTKAVDVSASLFQTFRPRAADKSWPAHALWPDHGVPRGVLVDRDAYSRYEVPQLAGPALVPETIVIDHGKVYVSEHVTSVCRRMGISIQPARLRTGRDKGPIERFFRTMRESLLEALPGYKGPDVYSRGLNPAGEAFFFLDELEAIIREWVAVIYHHRPHRGLVDPRLPGLELSPAMMFEQGAPARDMSRFLGTGIWDLSSSKSSTYRSTATAWRSTDAATTATASTTFAARPAPTWAPPRAVGPSTSISTTSPRSISGIRRPGPGISWTGNTPPCWRPRSASRL
ncbi:hypothetical protein [Streptosporangium sp. NPDC006930]|uniref:hypothetical protein n=1 Tax=unclassified Streptosporangium TaxID=2632669 RepID=UPI003414B3C3